MRFVASAIALCWSLHQRAVVIVHGFTVSPIPNHESVAPTKFSRCRNDVIHLQATTTNWKGGRLGGSFPQPVSTTSPVQQEVNSRITTANQRVHNDVRQNLDVLQRFRERQSVPLEQILLSRETWRPRQWVGTSRWCSSAGAWSNVKSQRKIRRQQHRRDAGLYLMSSWVSLFESKMAEWDNDCCADDEFMDLDATFWSNRYSQWNNHNGGDYDGDTLLTYQSAKEARKSLKRYMKHEWKRYKQGWKQAARSQWKQLRRKWKGRWNHELPPSDTTNVSRRRRRLWTATAVVLGLWWCKSAWIRTATLLYAGNFWVNHRNDKLPGDAFVSSTGAIKNAEHRLANADSEYTVVHLSVALQIPNRDAKDSMLVLLQQLSQTTALTQDRLGLQRLTQIVALELLRRSSSCVSASGTCQLYDDPRQAQYDFERIAVQERAKVQEETIHQYGGLNFSKRPYDHSHLDISAARRPTLAVVTLILAFSGGVILRQQQMAASIRSRHDLERALSTIAAQAKVGDSLESCEILWTPSDPNQSLAMGDIVADHPNLRPL